MVVEEFCPSWVQTPAVSLNHAGFGIQDLQLENADHHLCLFDHFCFYLYEFYPPVFDVFLLWPRPLTADPGGRLTGSRGSLSCFVCASVLHCGCQSVLVLTSMRSVWCHVRVLFGFLQKSFCFRNSESSVCSLGLELRTCNLILN